jgi:hypothetical protein
MDTLPIVPKPFAKRGDRENSPVNKNPEFGIIKPGRYFSSVQAFPVRSEPLVGMLHLFISSVIKSSYCITFSCKYQLANAYKLTSNTSSSALFLLRKSAEITVKTVANFKSTSIFMVATTTN